MELEERIFQPNFLFPLPLFVYLHQKLLRKMANSPVSSGFANTLSLKLIHSSIQTIVQSQWWNQKTHSVYRMVSTIIDYGIWIKIWRCKTISCLFQSLLYQVLLPQMNIDCSLEEMHFSADECNFQESLTIFEI